MTMRALYILLALALFFAGFLWSLWPLTALGIALGVAVGSWAEATTFALAADLLWGAPLGGMHAIAFPTTLIVLLCLAARALLMRFVRRRVPRTL